MPQLSLQNRHQIQMLSWEQFISCDNEVRVIDAFVDYLNLKELGFEQKGQSHESRSAFPYEVLLKLYLYSYLNRLRSSRQIAKACRVNVELLWLLGSLQPGYKTIANFRKNNGLGLKKVFKRYLLKGGFFTDCRYLQ